MASHFIGLGANPKSSYTIFAGTEPIDDSKTHGAIVPAGGHTIHYGETNKLYVGELDQESAGSTMTIGGTNATTINFGRTGQTVDVKGSMVVRENLTVEGTTFTVDSETVLIADNYLHINAGYDVEAAQTGGNVVTYDPDRVTRTRTSITSFTAGATITLSGTPANLFQAGDIVQVSDSDNNNGLYEILTNVGAAVTIDTTPTELFSQSAVTTETPSGTPYLTLVNVSVMRTDTSGDWEVGKGKAAGISYTPLATGGTSLQQAYVLGNTIVTSGGEGSFSVTGTEAFTLTSSATGAGSTISHVGAADQDLGITCSAGSLNLTGGEANASAVKINASNAAGGVDIDAGATSGVITANAGGGITLTAGGASGFTTSSGALTLTGAAASTWSTSSGKLSITGAGGIDLSDGTLTLSMLSGAISEAGLTTLSLTGSGAYTLTSGAAFTITGASASTWHLSSGDLTIGGASQANSLILQSAEATSDAVQIYASNAAGGIDVDAGTNGIKINSDGEIDIATDLGSGAGPAIDMDTAAGAAGGANDGGAYTLNTGNGGAGASGTLAGSAGDMTLVTGTGGANDVNGTPGTAGNGGSFALTTGAGGAAAGNPNLPAGDAGSLTFTGGDGGAGASAANSDGGDGGSFTFSAGTGGNGISIGGSDDGDGGSITFTCGAAGTGGAVAGAAGKIYLDADATGCWVDIDAGSGGVDVNSAGIIDLATDLGSGAGTAINVTTAAGAVGGPHNGGALTLATGAGGAGSATTGGVGGALTFTTGVGGIASVANNAGAGGAWSVTTGTGGAGGTTGNAAAGGAIALTTGTGGASGSNDAEVGGAGGAMTITTGAGGASTATNGDGGDGGDFSLVTGAGGAKTGSGTAGAAGDITLLPGGSGAVTSGARGVVSIGRVDDQVKSKLIIYGYGTGSGTESAEIVMYNNDNNPYVLWVDTEGRLRIEQASTKSTDTSGVVVGMQNE